MPEPSFGYSQDIAARMNLRIRDRGEQRYSLSTDNIFVPRPQTVSKARPDILIPKQTELIRSNDISTQNIVSADYSTGKINAVPPKVSRSFLQSFPDKVYIGRFLNWRKVLVGMAFVVFALGLIVDFQTIQVNKSARAQVSALSIKASDSSSSSNGMPSQQKPSSGVVNSYQVAPDLPKYLKISGLGVNARILQVGVTSKGALGTPSNVYDTAWYTGSARPGDPANQGAVLIDGHVQGMTAPGVFIAIKTLKPGDNIQIVRGDNQLFSYKVVKVQNFPESTINMNGLLQSIQPGVPGLNLITCGGPFDKKTWQYTERTVVYSVQTNT